MDKIDAVNTLLNSGNAGDDSQDIYLNVIHNEFMTFNGTIDIPRLPVSEINPDLSYGIILNLFPKIGRFLNNHRMLEHRNPPSEQHSIHLVKHLKGRVMEFCHIVRLDMKFSGDPSSIIERGNSGFYPSYTTNRVYYKSRLVPLERWNDDGSFVPQRIYDSAQAESDLHFHTYAIFDDINRTELTRRLCEAAGMELFPVSIDLYPFIVFDYFTACINILLPTEEELYTALELFEPLFVYIYGRFRDISRITTEKLSDIFPGRIGTNDGAAFLTSDFKNELIRYFGRKKPVRDDAMALKGWWKFSSAGES